MLRFFCLFVQELCSNQQLCWMRKEIQYKWNRNSFKLTTCERDLKINQNKTRYTRFTELSQACLHKHINIKLIQQKQKTASQMSFCKKIKNKKIIKPLEPITDFLITECECACCLPLQCSVMLGNEISPNISIRTSRNRMRLRWSRDSCFHFCRQMNNKRSSLHCNNRS